MVTKIELLAKIEKITIKQMYDNDPDYSYLEQEGFENKLKAFENGDFFYIGIKAEAEIITSYDGKNWLINKITSGGLWGIESNSGEDYLEEVRLEEERELKDILLKFGFDAGEIEDALSESETTTDY